MGTRIAQTESELLARVRALEGANDALRSLNAGLAGAADAATRELEAFSHAVAHDLRAPLRGINGFAGALLEDHAGALDSVGRDYLRRVGAGAKRMGELLDGLVALSRVGRAEVRRENVDLGRIAKAAADELARAQPERVVDFVSPEGIVASADAELVRTLLDNLLANAWKFTARRARGRVELSLVHEHGEPVYRVRDNGAGFDMAHAEKLFIPFQRLHAPTEFAGIGIGLAMVRRIARRHGGRVWAEGAVDEGATFYFTLPPPEAPAKP